MLTADLSRRKYSQHSDTVAPAWIKSNENYLALARQLIQIFQDHLGKRRKELEGTVEHLTAGDTDYKIIWGLAKLLEDECSFVTEAALEPWRIREALFDWANQRYPIVQRPSLMHSTQAQEIYAAGAQQLRLSLEAVRDGMYGDLEGNQVLAQFATNRRHRVTDPAWLLQRYNLALAQTLLYDASELTIRIYDHYQTVFGYMKLFRLMHEIHSLSPGYEVKLTGPASLFHLTRRYGVRMADFLPALVLCDRWEMEAQIVVDEELYKQRRFTLDQDCGLESHYQKRKKFDSELEKTLARKFARSKSPWKLHREAAVVDLGASVMIPDFSLVHPDGRRALLEIVGFWTPQYLAQKLAKVKQAKLSNLILAVSEQLNCSPEDFKDLTAQVLFFKSGIQISDVVKRAEQCALVPTPPQALQSHTV
jgi:predicted nuclease of restriction endonuclease-like RecB superfamily